MPFSPQKAVYSHTQTINGMHKFMGNQISSAFSCGVLEALAGDPDWTIASNGAIRRSATYRARAQSETEQRVRERLKAREDKCQSLERTIAEMNSEALACKRAIQTSGISLAVKQRAMARAALLLQNVTTAQRKLRATRGVLQKGNAMLSRIDVVQSGDDDVALFKDLAQLARGLEMTDAKVEAIEAAGEEVVDEQDKLGEYEDAVMSVAEKFQQTEATAGGIDGEFDLNNEEDLLAALQQLEDRQEASEWLPANPRQSNSVSFRTAAATNDGMVPVDLVGAPRAPEAQPGGMWMSQPSARTAAAVTTAGQVEQRGVGKRPTRFANVAEDMTTIL